MSESGISANRLELLQIADAVARDKSIDKSIVISAMEDAIQKAAKTRYGAENEIRAQIDPTTGQTSAAGVSAAIDPFMSPFQQQVIDTTRAQFEIFKFVCFFIFLFCNTKRRRA